MPDAALTKAELQELRLLLVMQCNWASFSDAAKADVRRFVCRLQEAIEAQP